MKRDCVLWSLDLSTEDPEFEVLETGRWLQIDQITVAGRKWTSLL